MTNPGKTDTTDRLIFLFTILRPAPLSAMPSPPSRDCLVQYVGSIWRWEGGGRGGVSKKFWITCLLGLGWAACECMYVRLSVCVAVHCSCAWVTWWLGSSGTSLDFLSPPQMGHCWLSYLDASFEEWKYDRCVRIVTRGRFPLAQSALIFLGFIYF